MMDVQLAGGGRLSVAVEGRGAPLLLGHSDLEETTIYLHVSTRQLHATPSPLDSLTLKRTKDE